MTLWYSENLVLVQSTLVSILFALSIQIPLRLGVFSFAGVGSYGIGSYATAILVTHDHEPFVLAVAVGVLISAVTGYALALLLQRLSGLYLGMATIAFDLIISVLATNGGSLTGGSGGIFDVTANVTTVDILVTTVVVLAIVALTERGRLGRKLEAVREDPELSAALGINVRRVRRLAFVASGALGALAGGINIALTTTIAPDDINFALVVLALTMIVVGGTRSWLGAVIGAVVFTWLPSVLAFVGDWKGVIYGAVVAVVAVWVPGGAVGVVTDLYRRTQARRRSSRSGPMLVPEGPDRTELAVAQLRALENPAAAGEPT